jgi:aryl-alcohol dehydrogenase-like predicted oxidoreductase
MRRVRLPGTEIETSALGFGTAQLGPRLSRRERERLLDAAFAAGITHFDTAPAYGFGVAHASLARFLDRRRDAVTVTTKAGIESRRFPLARRAVRLPALRGGVFDPTAVRASLERSLRALRTDHVDLFLLHECSPADVTDELVTLLSQIATEGSAIAVGTATSAAATADLLRRGASFPSVVQVPHAGLSSLPPAHGRAVITHSALSTGIPLEQALAENPDGIVLFSTRRPERIPRATS